MGCLAITNQPDTPLLFKSLNTSSNHNSRVCDENRIYQKYLEKYINSIASKTLPTIVSSLLLGCGNPEGISDEFYNEYKELGKPKILYSCTTIEHEAKRLSDDDHYDASLECVEKFGIADSTKIWVERSAKECPPRNQEGYHQCISELHREIYKDPDLLADYEKNAAKKDECMDEKNPLEEVEVVDVYHSSSQSALLNYNGLLGKAKDGCSGKFNILESEY